MRKKAILSLVPEIYLICATVYYWILTGTALNPFAIGLLLVLVFQLLSKKRIPGLIISSIFILLNLYMVLALLSELSEFEEPTGNYWKLLVVGALFLGLNLVMGGAMLWKYLNKPVNFNPAVLLPILLFNSCIIQNTKPEDCVVQNEKIIHIEEGTSYDIVFKDAGGDRYYINRGLEQGLNLDSLNAKVLNKTVTLHLAKVLGGLATSEHISQLSVNDDIIFTEFE